MTDRGVDKLALAERTVWEGLRAYGALPGVELIEDDSVRAVIGPVPYEGFNAIFLSTPDEIGGLTENLTMADGARVPMLAHVWSGAEEVEPHLTELLTAGFRFYEEEPAMVASLESNAYPTLPVGLSITSAQNEGDLKSWAKVLTGSDDVRFIGQVARLRSARTEDNEPAFEHLLARIEDEIVACAAVFGGTDAAEVQHVVTDARLRRRGIGTSMTTAAMLLAAERGYSQAVLTASPDGVEIYRRLGFHTCGTVRRYLHLPRR